MIDLRELQDDDCGRLFLWRRQPEVDRWMCGRVADSFDIHRRWFDDFRADPARRGWIIAEAGRAVGFLALTGLVGCDRRAEWGWYIGEDRARGRGIGWAAQALGLDRAFGEIGLNKVSAEILAENAAALRVQLGAGFHREGYLRRHVFKDGRFHDVVLLALLADEWRARREELFDALAAAHLVAA